MENISNEKRREIMELDGYNPDLWTIISAERAPDFVEEKGAINNMFKITNRKAVEVLGKGCYYAKQKWVFDTMDIMEAEGRLKPNLDSNPKAEKPKPVIPPPPVIPSPPPVENKTTDLEHELTFVCDREDKTGIVCDKQCPLCKEAQELGISPDELQKKKAKETVEKIVEETGAPKENVIVATVEAQDTNPEPEEVFPDCLDNSCETEEIPLNEDGSVNTTGMTEDEAREAIMDHQAKVSGPEGKGKAVGTLTAVKTVEAPKEVDEIQPEDLEAAAEKLDQIKEQAKSEKPKASTERIGEKPKKEKLKEKGFETLPIAPPELMEQLDMADTVIGMLQTFKSVHYVVHSIQSVLATDEKAEKKIDEIKIIIANNLK